MPQARKSRVRINFQCRYEANARNHGMTIAQMHTHDRLCYPEAELKPFLLWCSSRQIEWHSLHPESWSKIFPGFDRWIGGLNPELDALTCECHKKAWQSSSK